MQDDIKEQMPGQVTRFQNITATYSDIMKKSLQMAPITYQQFARLNIFPTKSDEMSNELDKLMFDINRYLVKKRRNFPRLYLLSNDDLMEMVGSSNNESLLQRDMIKLFPGIRKMIFAQSKKKEQKKKLVQNEAEPEFYDEDAETLQPGLQKQATIKEYKSNLSLRSKSSKGKSDDFYDSEESELHKPIKKDGCVLSKIIAVHNEQGEQLDLFRPVLLEDTLDVWCNVLEHEMEVSVSRAIQGCYAQDSTDEKFLSWIKQWPTQMLLIALDLHFANQMKDVFMATIYNQATGSRKPSGAVNYAHMLKINQRNMDTKLKKMQEYVSKEYLQLTQLVKRQMGDNDRMKVQNILINRIHVRDKISIFQRQTYEYCQDFLLKINLKYELMPDVDPLSDLPNEDWEAPIDFRNRKNYKPLTEEQKIAQGPKMKLHAKVLHVNKIYGYEYMPNSTRLVVTPLTEKVFQSLFLAMYYDFGAAPFGPAGTGKTETIKDLAKRIGRNCFVYNCSVNMHISQVADLVTGVVACGYWSCFDEFNRIDLSVLQVLSEMFITIQTTKILSKQQRQPITEIELEGVKIPFRLECGIFITLNPYAIGRSKLPSNLQNLFRMVAMTVPDSTLIANVILMNAGFERAKVLSEKIMNVFQITTEQISMKQHYDFGLRSIRSVLDQASKLKQKAMMLEDDEQKKQNEAGGALISYTCLIKPWVPPKEKKQSPSKAKQQSQVQKKPQGGLLARMAQKKTTNDESPVKKVETTQPKQELHEDTIEFTVDESSEMIDSEASQRKQPEIVHEKFDYMFVKNMIDPDCENQDISNEEQLEDFIALKAVRDVQMPRLAFEDQQVFMNICSDIFPTTPKPKMFLEIKLKDTFADVSQTLIGGSLRMVTTRTIQTEKTEEEKLASYLTLRLRKIAEEKLQKARLFCGEPFLLRVIQLYQQIQSRHGIMLVGKPMTGKTTILKIAQEVSKQLSKQEFLKRQKSFLRQKAIQMGIPFTEDEKSDVIKLENADANLAKIFMPTETEKRLIQDTQIFHDVISWTINPKSMTHDRFFGVYNVENNIFKDGVLTTLFRDGNADDSAKLKMLVFDGPIEPTWVENLNSVLDDNRRLFFGNGDWLPLSQKMRVVLEASDLSQCSPATVSRCGVVFMEDGEDVIPLKSHVNSWIKKMPEILESEKDRFDMIVNYFLSHINEEFLDPANLVHPVSKKQAMMTFTHILEACLSDYRQPKYTYQKRIEILRLYKASTKITYDWGNLEVPPPEESSVGDMTKRNEITPVASQPASEMPSNGDIPSQEERQINKQEEIAQDVAKQKPQSPEVETVPEWRQKDYRRLKFPQQTFASQEQGQKFIDSINLKTKWLHSYFLFACIWAFGVNLRPEKKNEFEEWLVFQACKKLPKDKAVKQKPKFTLGSFSDSSGSGDQDESEESEYKVEHILVDDVKEGEDGFKFEPTASFHQGQRVLASYLPNECRITEGQSPKDRWSIFDMYFDIEHDDWVHFDALRNCCLMDQSISLRQMDANDKGQLFHNFWVTLDSIRYGYLLDRLIMAKFHVLLVGPTGVGKSKLMHQFGKKGLKSGGLVRKDFPMTGTCDAETFKEFMTRDMSTSRKSMTIKPTIKETKHLFFIDDLNMCQPDEFNIIETHELLRQWFDHEGWYSNSPEAKGFLKAKSIQFIASISLTEDSCGPTQKSQIDERLQWHFSVVTHVNKDQNYNHLFEIYQQILDYIMPTWDITVQEFQTSIMALSMEFDLHLKESIQPSPNSFTQKINSRQLLSSLFGMVDCHIRDKKTNEQLMCLFINELKHATLERSPNETTKQKSLIYLKSKAEVEFKVAVKMFKQNQKATFDRPLFSYIKKDQVNIYCRVEDRKREQDTFHEAVQSYNSLNFKHPMSMTLFDFMLDNVMRCSRSLRQPLPGTIIVAQEGSGVWKIAKLSLLISEYSAKEFSASLKIFDKEKWISDLKNVMHALSADAKPTVLQFEEQELSQPQVMSDLNALMAHGELISLFTQEEQAIIVNRMKNSKGGTSLGNLDTSRHLSDFKELCLQNIKILTTLTPNGPIYRKKLRNYNHIINCSTMINMGDWGQQGLYLVAEGVLGSKGGEGKESIFDDPLVLQNEQKISDVMVKIYLDCQNLVRSIYQKKQKQFYCSPSHFTHFVEHFNMIFRQQRAKYKELIQSFDRGLKGIETTMQQIDLVQERLSETAPKLVDKQIELETLLRESDNKKEGIQKKIHMLMLEEKVLDYQKLQGKRVQKNCHSSFASVIPVLNKAVTGLQQLNKRDIDELRSLVNPPQSIKTMLQGVCLILHVKPLLIPIPLEHRKFKEDYWTPSVGPKVLGAKNIVAKLAAIDPTTLNQETLNKLENLMEKPEFSYARVEYSCVAAKSLFQWVRAVRNYYYVYRMSQHYRNKVIVSDLQAKKHSTIMAEHKDKITDLTKQLSDIKFDFKDQHQDIKSFGKQIDDCYVMKSRAARLIDALGNEKFKWQTCKQLAVKKQKHLEGDCIIAAAIVIFLAPFDYKIRDYLAFKWEQWIRDMKIPCTKELNFNSHFMPSSGVQYWIEKGLPNDSFSIQSACIKHFVQIQTVILDPHGQAKKLFSGLNQNMVTLNQESQKFNDRLKVALQLGNFVFIEGVHSKISRTLFPMIKMASKKRLVGKEYEVELDGRMVPVNYDFELLVSSVSTSPDFGAEINEYIIMVNFELTEQAFDAQIMSIIIQEVETDTEVRLRKVKKEALNFVKEIKAVEENILVRLQDFDDPESMVANENLIDLLSSCQIWSDKIGSSMKDIQTLTKSLHKKKSEYSKLTKRATKLFFLVTEFQNLNPVYQFTHQWFFEVFLDVLQKQLDDPAKPQFEEIMHRFTYIFFSMVCQQIFEKDKLLFSFMLAYKTLQADKNLDFRQVEFFIKGQLSSTKKNAPKQHYTSKIGMLFGPDGKKLTGKLPKDNVEKKETQKLPSVNYGSFLKPQTRQTGPQKPVSKLSSVSLAFGNKIVEKASELESDSVVSNDHVFALGAVNMSAGIHKKIEEKKVKAKKLKKRLKKVPWLTAQQWKLIDKLSKITPFNQPNESNSCENLAAHVEEFPQEWYDYIFYDRSQEEARLEEQFIKATKKQSGSMIKPAERSARQMEKDRLESERVNLQKIMPGGYQKFDYQEQHKVRLEQNRVAGDAARNVKMNLAKMMQGRSKPTKDEGKKQKEIDDFFARNKEESSDDGYDMFSQGTMINRKVQIGSEHGQVSEDDVLDALDDTNPIHRKNNLEDEIEIAEAIICGIAQYNEMDVRNPDDDKPIEERNLTINVDVLRLCVTRCFRPDKMMEDIKDFVIKILGNKYVSQPPQNFNDYVWPNTNRFKPILVMMGENIDCSEELKLIKAKSKHCHSTGDEGLIIVPCGNGKYSKIARKIIDAATRGHWVLLDNIHLCLEMLPYLQQLISALTMMHWEYSDGLNKRATYDLELAKESAKILAKKGFMADGGDPDQADDVFMATDKTKNTRKAREQRTMKEFSEGRANFADSAETDFGGQMCPKPDFASYSKPRKSYLECKIQSRKKIQDYLTVLANKIDNTDQESENVGIGKTADEKRLDEMLLPSGWSFPIKSKFRLFVSSLPLKDFPATFARRSTKMTIELPSTVQRIAKKNLDKIKPAQLQCVTGFKQWCDEYRKILVAVSLLHAVVSRREQFGAFGWSKPGYEFSPNDFEMSVKQQLDLFRQMKSDQRMPVQLIQHIMASLNYGSIVTNLRDQECLREIIKTFINMQMFFIPITQTTPDPYDLSGKCCEELQDKRILEDNDLRIIWQNQIATSAHGFARNYFIPPRLPDRNTMKELIRAKIPEEDKIELFGLHETSSNKSKMERAYELIGRVVTHQFVMPVPHSEILKIGKQYEDEEAYQALTPEQMQEQRYTKLMKKMDPILIQMSRIRDFSSISPPRESDYCDTSLNALLNKEMKQYETLKAVINASVEHTIYVLLGLKMEDKVVRETFRSIQANKTPLSWIKNRCYPAFRTLETFMENLIDRTEYLEQNIKKYNERTAEDDIRCFYLPYFFDPKAVFTTMLQWVSRQSGISIEMIKMKYRMMKNDEKMYDFFQARETNSFYLEGLWINGAQWVERDYSIDQCKYAHQTSMKMPRMHVTMYRIDSPIDIIKYVPPKKATEDLTYTLQTTKGSIKSKGTSNRQVDRSMNKSAQKSHLDFQTVDIPLYVTSLRNRAILDNTKEDISIIQLPIPTKFFKPAFWIRRNIALICYKDTLDH